MTDVKNKYGTQGQAITITLASLANNGARQATVVDNTSDLFLDVLLMLKVKSGASGVSATGYVEIFAYGTVDDGTTYSEGATGADGAITLTSVPNVRLIGIINVVANATTYMGGPFSVAAPFGGVLPKKWGIIVRNKSGAALDAAEGSHAKLYQGVLGQAV